MKNEISIKQKKLYWSAQNLFLKVLRESGCTIFAFNFSDTHFSK